MPTNVEGVTLTRVPSVKMMPFGAIARITPLSSTCTLNELSATGVPSARARGLAVKLVISSRATVVSQISFLVIVIQDPFVSVVYWLTVGRLKRYGVKP